MNRQAPKTAPSCVLARRAPRVSRLAPRDGMRSNACVDATRAINVCLARCVEVWRRAPRRSNEKAHAALDRHISTRGDDGLARVDAHAPKTVKPFRTCAISPRNTATRARTRTPSRQEASA